MVLFLQRLEKNIKEKAKPRVTGGRKATDIVVDMAGPPCNEGEFGFCFLAKKGYKNQKGGKK